MIGRVAATAVINHIHAIDAVTTKLIRMRRTFWARYKFFIRSDQIRLEFRVVGVESAVSTERVVVIRDRVFNS